MNLEFKAPFAVKQQVFRKPSPVFAKSRVQGIVAHSPEPIPNGGENVVELSLVFLVIKLTARLAKGSRFAVARRFDHVARFEEDLQGRG
jgi:hypothetical protein